MSNPDNTPWYETAFRQDYLARYPHRNTTAAAQDLPFIEKALSVHHDEPVLDLCCGAGRYSNALAERGLRIIGVDLSGDLLRGARSPDSSATYFRGDMRRLPFRDEVFGGIVNLFTSFGYFEADEENLAALEEAARVLKTGGTLLLDFFNRTRTLATLEPRTERRIGEQQIVETRAFNAKRGRIEKTIRMSLEGKPELERVLVESVRAFSAEELAHLIASAGLTVRSRHGDLRGTSFQEQSSERCVLIARKSRPTSS